MTTDESITIRTATDDDWDAVALLDAHAFGEHQNAEDLAETQILTQSEHVYLAWDGETPVGVAMHFPMSVTVPGGAQVEASGVSWVSVAPTHRRRAVGLRGGAPAGAGSSRGGGSLQPPTTP